jgi:hypothetical protein
MPLNSSSKASALAFPASKTSIKMIAEIAKTDANDPYGLLLMPSPPRPPSRAAIQAAYEYSLRSVVQTLKQHHRMLASTSSYRSGRRYNLIAFQISLQYLCWSAESIHFCPYLRRKRHSSVRIGFYRHQALVDAIRCGGDIIVYR